ncbi:S41 family peptidase [Reichenbachiella agarivorans]|uniref:S41 family peptidase n=1 Tax=Reichenbachiella agarivorans TaxID=2979464 RepID=A0ABY6CKY7_9BACT|nr:S41 family peptidase [Reichenbachiella agarivorans]UXP31152.1 S41 family peptidase [Reichenbachiella agarivorans]
MMKQLKWGFALCYLFTTALTACKDYSEGVEVDTYEPSRTELTLDSIFLYAKEIYFWNDQLPTYEDFAPRAYAASTDDLSIFEEELYDITQFAINSETGRPYEYRQGYAGTPKYSFIEENESNTSAFAVLQSSYLDGTDDDYGFALTAIAANEIRVRYVVTGSTAYKAGIRRGDILIAVGGEEVRADSNADITRINSAFDGDTFELTVMDQDSVVLNTTLVRSTYTINPVFKDSVLETSAGKVGYLAYSTFSSLSNSQDVLDEVFAEFAAANIKDVVIDLRYNGGGYIATADYLINQIIPSSLNNRDMYVERYNELMQGGDATILENQLLKDANGDNIDYRGRYANYNDLDYSEDGNTFTFSKEGDLETIENVYVIISDATASASELVINTLKPYLNVILIGTTSYGKPVGFFGIEIDDYTMYIPNFQTVNSDEEGDYFDGMVPDFEINDDVTRDFGDTEESCLATAIAIITGDGTTARSSSTSSYSLLHLGNMPHTAVMIEHRRTLKQ